MAVPVPGWWRPAEAQLSKSCVLRKWFNWLTDFMNTWQVSTSSGNSVSRRRRFWCRPQDTLSKWTLLPTYLPGNCTYTQPHSAFYLVDWVLQWHYYLTNYASFLGHNRNSRFLCTVRKSPLKSPVPFALTRMHFLSLQLTSALGN